MLKDNLETNSEEQTGNTKGPQEEGAPGAPPSAAFMQLMFGKQIAFALSAVARLGVADHMGAAAVSVDELSGKVGARAPALYRVMRLLASVGVFEETREKQFALTPTGELLKTDAPDSLRYIAILWGEEWNTRNYGRMADCLRTGLDGITLEYGKNAFELLAEKPEWSERFQRAMSNFSAAASAAILEAYDFSGIRCLADVGGGHGRLLASILEQYPRMQGVLFDLPEVVEGAPSGQHFARCEDRVRIDSGSFFEHVPAGCDAYILKHIIHDWSDADCAKILRLIRAQLPADGRVLLCEMVVPEGSGFAPAKALDMEMLVVTPGGRERTEAEFRELFAAADLRLARIVPTKGPLCVVEGRPV